LDRETPITLQYPNGRVHHTTLHRDLLRGDQFELYGRKWTAVRTRHVRGQRHRPAELRIVCVNL
jgi:hypothetical protein